MSKITKLSAVNSMIGMLGEFPIATLNAELPPHVLAALDILDRQTSTLQAPLYWFNKEVVRLLPNQEDNEIYVPNDVASADAIDSRMQVAVRGNRLFSLDDGSFKFRGPLLVRLHRVLAFEDLPMTMANYVLQAARLEYQMQYDGDPSKTQMLREASMNAYAMVTMEDTRNSQANMLNSPGMARARLNIGPYRSVGDTRWRRL